MKTINEYFDKIYCINLDKRIDRWKNCEEQFNKFNISVQRISAIDGHPSHIKVNSPVFKTRAGLVGCGLSHIKIFEDAKKENFKQILILEDDIMFIDNFNEKFSNIINQIPDNWDMIYLSGNNDAKRNILIKISDNIYKTNYTLSTHSYAIKSYMYDILTNVINKWNRPLDRSFAEEIHPIFNCYVIKPYLCWQKEGYSDIMKKYTDYKCTKKLNDNS